MVPEENRESLSPPQTVRLAPAHVNPLASLLSRNEQVIAHYKAKVANLKADKAQEEVAKQIKEALGMN